jgi:hypothetical protein
MDQKAGTNGQLDFYGLQMGFKRFNLLGTR